jgi:hypothetical protein
VGCTPSTICPDRRELIDDGNTRGEWGADQDFMTRYGDPFE